MGEISESEVEAAFTYQAPSCEVVAAFVDLRANALMLARYIEETCPECRERSLAITRLREAVMWSKAAMEQKGLNHARKP
jgi:hypothetical protein